MADRVFLTRHQAQAVAWVIHDSIRADWDEAGIVKALHEARMMADAPDLIIAAIVAARTPSNRTPGVIPLAGPHWAHTAVLRPPSGRATPTRDETCGVCYLGRDKCRARWSGDHEFESLDDARKRRVPPPVIPTPKKPNQQEYLNGRPVTEVELP